MKRNITYLLGAGASFHSLPVVDSMNARLTMFMALLNPDNLTSEISKYRKYTGVLYDRFNPLLIEANNHRTIDTYAKKLWLTNRDEDLAKLKVLLDLYFSFEQDINKSIYTNDSIFDKKENNATWPQIGKTLDYRYDVFLATLLDKSLILPENISIISWNYDNQLELAYSQFIGNENNYSISKNLGIYPTNYSDLTENKRIIKLNGQALYQGTINRSEISDLASKLEYLFYNKIETFPTSISFAWEEGEQQSESLNKALKVFNQTQELIVIGYSFPSFNRSIDAKLFSGLNQLHKIKVQCVSKDYKSIYATISDMPNWEGPSHFEKVVQLHENLDQFYIPSNQLMYSV